MKKKKKIKKVKITWTFHPLNKKKSYLLKYVYIERVVGSPSGQIHVKGFDVRFPHRFIGFYDKDVAKGWIKEKKFKLLKFKMWKKKFKHALRKHNIPFKETTFYKPKFAVGETVLIKKAQGEITAIDIKDGEWYFQVKLPSTVVRKKT